MGHILTTDGLKPSTEIAKAVLEMPQPQDKAATRRFLNTITYLSKFCPNLSEIVTHYGFLLMSSKILSGLTNIPKHSMKLNNWYPQPHSCATLMYALPLFYKLMHQNMALVLHFFNPLPTLTHLAMFNYNLWLTVPALSHLLNSVTPRSKKKHLPWFMHFRSLINCSLESPT